MNERKYNVISAICIVCIVLAVIAFLLIYYSNKNDEFVYNEHLEENVLTVTETAGNEVTVNVNMQEMAYYIINVEGDVNQMACQYDSENPGAYWSLKIETIYTIRDYAKDLAMDSCIRDNIYYIEAVKNNVTLTEEEEELASEDARTIMKNLTDRQMDVSDYSHNVVYDIQKKLYLASKYVNSLVENGYTMEELELKGSYYEELKLQYDITENEELWDEVKLGNLTVKTKED